MHPIMKKKRLLQAVVLLLLLAMLPACDLLEDCGTCELVTIDAEGNSSSSTPMLFCGDQLQERQNSSPVTVAGVTTYWECY